MKVLISAYACETGRGGEGEIGWRMVRRLAADHDVWVITRANLRAVHEAAFRQEPKPDRLHFVYFDLPWVFRFYKRGKRLFFLYYYLWQIGSGLFARRLMRKQRFDLCHHLTGGMDWMPAGLALCKAPLLWGPVGSEDTHRVILDKLSLTSRLKDRVRAFVRALMRHGDPLVRLTGRRARLVLSHTPETMPNRLAAKLMPFTQTAIENTAQLARPKTEVARKGALRLLYAGELKDWKGALLALDAALLFFEREPSSLLTIVGDGPLRRRMEAIVAEHPQGNRVTMHGQVPMQRLTELMQESDLFLYPSFHHGLATVVLQAMLTGLPVICLEGDATGRATGQEAGITVALKRDRDPVADLANAIDTLAVDEGRRQSLAANAQRIARQRHTYDALASAMASQYLLVGNTCP
ncbi:glycosyltransferase family 4 protein [Rhizobium sp. NRK18]|uniref:glycosyltransferase family 4 protein n=1 Tax=Rhizobium sp. NRK18 TaxID=2964667 RepID=UPI0021C34434|nr:glycosyltransferase family 4 protein [Rhizobium sp. NRK18]MCQ2003195.1 glycosyltransferase family 4 protein [Rhizobium sp. NRK18]